MKLTPMWTRRPRRVGIRGGRRFSDATGTSRPRGRLFRAFVVGLLSLVLPPALTAAPVSADQAGRAARAWAVRGKTLGAKLGSSVERVHAHATTNGTAFYAVKMSGGGTVFLSSDTETAPVVGFTSDEREFSTLDPKEPLWALLNRDFSIRGDGVKARRLKLLSSAAGTAEPSKNEQSWSALFAEADATNTPRLALASAIHDAGGVGDLRVPALVKSKWSQSVAWNPSAGSYKACYNYYTPNGSDKTKFVEGSVDNEVCGCVATAMSQVMRYHKYPNGSVTPVTRSCRWGISSSKSAALSLTTQGGTYDWDSMALVPDGASLSAANYKAIGKLTSDAGITVYMQYHLYGTSGSGAYSFDIAAALTSVWGYRSAVYYDASYTDMTVGSSERIAALRNSLFSNFDAGYPVCLGIPGHSIVADGYGFNGNYDYVHLNMGWAGTDDYWYNLPDATEADSDFNGLDEVIYNIFPDKGTNCGVVSGRALDANGAAVSGASVELWSGSTLADTVTTSSTGVWGAAVPGGSYTVIVTSADGRMKGTLSNVSVQKPNAYQDTYQGRSYLLVNDVSDLGNSWGNDITLVKTASFDVLEHPAFVPYTRVTHAAGGETSVKVESKFTEGGNAVYSLLTEKGRAYALGQDGQPSGDWVTGDGTPQLLRAPKLASVEYQVLVK